MIFIDNKGKINIVNRQDFTTDKEYFSKIYYIKTNKNINYNNQDKKNIISTILYEDK